MALPPTKKISGIITLLPLLLIAAIAIAGFFVLKNSPGLLQNFSLSLTLTNTPEPSFPNLTSPTVSPSSSPSATPKPSVSPTPQTPQPTLKPVSSLPAGKAGPPGSGYSSITVRTEKGDFSAKILSLDLGNTRVITDTASDSDCPDNCPTMPLGNFVAKNGGYAGVNGTYFCPDTYPECAGKKNSFDFPVYNSRLGKWINGGNLFWNGRAMVYFDGGGGHYKQNANSFGGGLSAGIVNYPGLLDGGNVQIDDNQSGLSDKQRAKGTKVGIGLRGSTNVMVVIASNVNMQEFAYVFKGLSADSALNLDTGGSTALYFGGRYLAGPGRNLPNAIVFASK